MSSAASIPGFKQPFESNILIAGPTGIVFFKIQKESWESNSLSLVLLPPNSHFKVQESHNLLCVFLGASESWGPLSPQSTTPPFRQDPNRAKGGSHYGKTMFQVY